MREDAAAPDELVQEVLDVLLRLAAADLDARVPTPTGDTPIELVSVAVNMLAEELCASMANERKLRAELEREVAMRTAELEKLARAQEVIRELSTPVIEIGAGILMLPLVGVVDTVRGEQVMEQLLDASVRTRAKAAIIDITGVPEVDTNVAHQLLKVTAAAGLLGVRTVLTGVSPANAETLVRLGVDFSNVITARSLTSGLRATLKLIETDR